MTELTVSKKHHSIVSVIVMLLVALLSLFLIVGITGCSGKSSSSGTAKQATVNGHPVSEYNANVPI